MAKNYNGPSEEDREASASTGQGRMALARTGRVVIKLGTRVLTQGDGRLALSRLFTIVEVVGSLVRAGRQVLLVSSGAVGLGREALGFKEIPERLEERQACAAVGQSRLMQHYQKGFDHQGLICAQILLSEMDFGDRGRYLNLRHTLHTLLLHGAVPVINENDALSTEELAFVPGEERKIFGDNDRLSALVASKLDADLLVLLTDVPAVYDRDPRHDPEARQVRVVEDPASLAEVAAGPASPGSRGGMRSKIDAALIAARSGCHAVIASGLAPDALRQAVQGEVVGTWFPAQGNLPAKRRWIAFAAQTRGFVRIDSGAVQALRECRASLLAAGIREVQGEFNKGDVVEIQDGSGRVIGRGMASCDAATARQWSRTGPVLEKRNHRPVVRREQLVLEI
jgi:glutamate 5-kinase